MFDIYNRHSFMRQCHVNRSRQFIEKTHLNKWDCPVKLKSVTKEYDKNITQKRLKL